MADIYSVGGSDDYIVADEELGITDFYVAAAPDTQFDKQVDGMSTEELAPPGTMIEVVEREGEELKWFEASPGDLADTLERYF